MPAVVGRVVDQMCKNVRQVIQEGVSGHALFQRLQIFNRFVAFGISIGVERYVVVAGNFEDVSFYICEIKEQPAEWRSRGLL